MEVCLFVGMIKNNFFLLQKFKKDWRQKKMVNGNLM